MATKRAMTMVRRVLTDGYGGAQRAGEPIVGKILDPDVLELKLGHIDHVAGASVGNAMRTHIAGLEDAILLLVEALEKAKSAMARKDFERPALVDTALHHVGKL